MSNKKSMTKAENDEDGKEEKLKASHFEKPISNVSESMLKEYTNELRDVYRDIDRSSSLLWSHDNALVRPKRRSIKKEAELKEDYSWK